MIDLLEKVLKRYELTPSDDPKVDEGIRLTLKTLLIYGEKFENGTMDEFQVKQAILMELMR